MVLLVFFLLAVLATVEGATTFDHEVDLPTTLPLVLGHRGSSGILPEHTVAAYRRAITDGSDVIECDVHLTRDLIPVCLHDKTLSASTNIDTVGAFANRKSTYTVKGTTITDWFAIDFTLAELKTLRAKQPLSFRDPRFNSMYQISTFQEHINVAKAASRTIGIYPETKSPAWHNEVLTSRGETTTMEKIVVDMIKANGYDGPRDPCFLQSFEEASLTAMKQLTNVPLVMLTDAGQPTNAELQRWASNFYGLGAWKDQVAQHWNAANGYKNAIFNRSDLVERAHRAGLKLHLYTFRNEDRYLAWDFNQDPYDELRYYAAKDVDGYFSDFPHTLRNFVDEYYAEEDPRCTGQDPTGYTCAADNNPCWGPNFPGECNFHFTHVTDEKFVQCNEWGTQCFVMPCAPGTAWSQALCTCA